MRLVVDASACAEFLLGSRLGRQAAVWMMTADSLHAPELLVSEVTSAMRGLVRAGKVSDAEAQLALQDLGDLALDLVSAMKLLPSVWPLSAGSSSYDAHYLALATAIDGTLLTCDARLAAVCPSAGVAVELLRDRP